MTPSDEDIREALRPFVHDAAVAWCGRKERETGISDIEYFEHNWWAIPGLRGFVTEFAATRTIAKLRIAREENEVLRTENQRLSRHIASGVLGDLLDTAEKDALVQLIRFLRTSPDARTALAATETTDDR
jgi:hypothetical protein